MEKPGGGRLGDKLDHDIARRTTHHTILPVTHRFRSGLRRLASARPIACQRVARQLEWLAELVGDPKAFDEPCAPALEAFDSRAPVGCTPLTGSRLGGARRSCQARDHRPGISPILENFPITETRYLQFRTEFFNITNHPNFNAPNFGGNGVVAIPNSGNYNSSTFGEIGSTRDAPYDPRQIQFALKFYW